MDNIVLHLRAKYQKGRVKTEGAYSTWKKNKGRMTDGRMAQHRITFADYVSSGAKHQNCTSLAFCWHNDIKCKHFPHYWPFVWGIHRSPVNSPHKGQWRGALMFSLICTRINGWVNNHMIGYFDMPSRPLWRHCNGWIPQVVTGTSGAYRGECYVASPSRENL